MVLQVLSPGPGGKALADRRKAEQEAAAQILGVAQVHWLGLPDTALRRVSDLPERIATVIRTVQPNTKVAIDAVFDRKLQAVLAHQNQFSGEQAEWM